MKQIGLFRRFYGKISENSYRNNEVHVQMLSKSLYNQIFKQKEQNKRKSFEAIDKWRKDLIKHGLKIEEITKLKDVDLKLPRLKGKNIEEHFYEIANDQSGPYKNLVSSLLCNLPKAPDKWSMTEGWTKYDPENGTGVSVDYPDASALVFDVEICVLSGGGPTLATAVSPTNWYSWVSPSLINLAGRLEGHKYHTDEFIPLESTSNEFGLNLGEKFKMPKIIVGHNVSFDRARIKEQYWIENTGMRFLDTMSLHVCVSGLTSYQRAMLKSHKELDPEEENWINQSSLNNLADVYKLYCDKTLDKAKRDTFVEGTLEDIKNDFQNLMSYCAGDVKATHEVLLKLFPLFSERFQHPATLAGMLEIGCAYLPVNSNWNRYIEESNLSYEDLDIESKYLLAKRADNACQLMHDEMYKKDLWMWDQDWSVQGLKLKKVVKKSKKSISNDKLTSENEDEEEENKFQHLYDMSKLLPVKRSLLPGYPTWYRKLCTKVDYGPTNIGTGMQITPKLLKLSWEGYPLHFIRGHGWGFLGKL